MTEHTAIQPWYVYLLRCADDTLYCGITTNLTRRLAQHNAGTASKYTRARLPVSLATAVEQPSKSAALRLEMDVKKLPARNKIAWLESTPHQGEAICPS
ncbi:MAG: GIY-YIG nuclease family protein [Proteobacteria bacterium]|nr:GIY-YIG nuclease family protein [Pseudomonadota bacterium]